MEHPARPHHNILAYSDESTVLAEYIPPQENPSDKFESEAALEKNFIKQLTELAYERLYITKEEDLIQNLRTQIEKLNQFTFSESEWTRFFKEAIASKNMDILDKSKSIHTDQGLYAFKCDNNLTKNIKIIDRDNIHNNHLQVLNQYEADGGKHANRYDVTILVNGLPMVHCELKRRGVNLREAFNQIERYQRQSFWADSGLFEYVQIFIISNGTITKYYANSVRKSHIDEKTKSTKRKNKTARSFSFTNYWSDGKNKIITDIRHFTRTFFAKHTLLNILTKYCIFNTNNDLLVMRPYQIIAAEKIIERIKISLHDPKKLGKPQGGGYIWHTTGSGKTLTSFKTAQLAYKIPEIEKVFFIVDRKDLDSQTVKEYNNFKEGSVDNTSSTAKLKENIESKDNKIIVTTIQKLSRFLTKYKDHEIYQKHVVLIFDECHRSQFGDMHSDITKKFKKYNLFGFTGTPIFDENTLKSAHPNFKTTAQIFGDQLHSYTIVDAINDQNVLPFRVEYVNTIKTKEIKEIEEKQVAGINTEEALNHPERITLITNYILEHFAQKTKRNTFYTDKNAQRQNGFNSLFATSSIKAAQKYYAEFKKQQEVLPEEERLKIGIIYSFAPNQDVDTLIEETDENSSSTEELPKDDRDFLEEAIEDYNKIYNSNYDTSTGFENYYRDLCDKLKKKEIDIVIVVNMFLTGFDAPTLNTLWVDKFLKYHGLIQAYSRTNRILNSVKAFGNIVSFRNLDDATNKALTLFGNKDAKAIAVLKSYHEFYEDYKNVIHKLTEKFGLPLSCADILSAGEKSKEDFVKIFGAILRLKNILLSFDEFRDNHILTEREESDYQSLYEELRRKTLVDIKAGKEDITEDLVFEVELIKQVDVNVDYIISLVTQYVQDNNDNDMKETILRAINASPSLHNKKDLIEAFMSIVSLESDDDIKDQWQNFMQARKEEELTQLITEEKLKKEETLNYINNAFKNGEAPPYYGNALPSIMPRMSRFDKNNNRAETKDRIFSKISTIFDRFYGMF